MRILVAITYYAPHVSGVTVYARRLVRRLTADGHEVTILTSRYREDLPRVEQIDGAEVIRSTVLSRLGKGVIMPYFLIDAFRLAHDKDIVHIHLPQLEGSGVALVSKLVRKPVVSTYHCDIELPRGALRFVFTPLIRVSHYLAGKLSNRIVVNTAEYGRSARLPARFQQKVLAIYPPIELPEPKLTPAEFRSRYGLGDGLLVGFVGRYAEEKGLDFLLRAVPVVRQQLPGVRFVLAGPTDSVPGERVHEWLQPKIDALGDAVTHVGLLSDPDLTTFYQTIGALVLPSTNSTESFGMTQAEALLAGTPVVASDIPGVREVALATGMGLLVPPRDPASIADAIVTVLREPDQFVRPPEVIWDLFNPTRNSRFYEELFVQMTKGTADSDASVRELSQGPSHDE